MYIIHIVIYAGVEENFLIVFVCFFFFVRILGCLDFLACIKQYFLL